MPNRIIKESICTSEDVDQLTPQEEIFFYRLMVNCDDFGRMDGRLPILKAKLYPLKPKVKLSDIEKYLTKLSTIKPTPLIILYINGNIRYIQMTKWEKHQQKRAHHSKYPALDDSKTTMKSYDINGYQRISNVPENREYENTRIENRECASIEFSFDKFWEAYPRKKSKGDAEKAWNKIKFTDELFNQIMLAVDQAKKTADWKKDNGQFIPYPATWLNQKGWLDEIKPDKPKQDKIHNFEERQYEPGVLDNLYEKF